MKLMNKNSDFQQFQNWKVHTYLVVQFLVGILATKRFLFFFFFFFLLFFIIFFFFFFFFWNKMGISTMLSIPKEGNFEKAEQTEDEQELREIVHGDDWEKTRFVAYIENEDEKEEDKKEREERDKETEKLVGKEVVKIDLDRTGFVMNYLLSGDVENIGASVKAKVPLSCRSGRSNKYYVVQAGTESVSTSYGSPCSSYNPSGMTHLTHTHKHTNTQTHKHTQTHSPLLPTGSLGFGCPPSKRKKYDLSSPTSYSNLFPPKTAHCFVEAEGMIVAKMKQKPPYKIDLNLGEKEKKHPDVGGMKKGELVEWLEERGFGTGGMVNELRARVGLIHMFNPESEYFLFLFFSLFVCLIVGCLFIGFILFFLFVNLVFTFFSFFNSDYKLPPYNPDLRFFQSGTNTKVNLPMGPGSVYSKEEALTFATALEEIDEKEILFVVKGEGARDRIIINLLTSLTLTIKIVNDFIPIC